MIPKTGVWVYYFLYKINPFLLQDINGPEMSTPPNVHQPGSVQNRRVKSKLGLNTTPGLKELFRLALLAALMHTTDAEITTEKPECCLATNPNHDGVKTTTRQHSRARLEQTNS